MSCEQPSQAYALISMGLGHSQLAHRRVAHDLKYSLGTNLFIELVSIGDAADPNVWSGVRQVLILEELVQLGHRGLNRGPVEQVLKVNLDEAQ
jgi:hypothetical protein